MKKLFTTLAIICASFALTSFDSNIPVNEQQSATVYICTGGSSKKYHKSGSCNGLRNCGGEIKAITKEQAEQMGRTPCKICYK